MACACYINGDMFTVDLSDIGKIEGDLNGLQQAVNKHPELSPQVASTLQKRLQKWPVKTERVLGQRLLGLSKGNGI